MSTEIKPEIRTLADVIKGKMSLGEEGVITIDGDITEALLPENLDMSTVKMYQDHQSNLVAATGLALGEVGIDAFEKDKRLDRVSTEFNFGKDTIGGGFDRMKEYRTSMEAGAPMAPKYGVLSPKYTVAASAPKGSLKKVKSYLNEQALAVLGS